MSVMPASRRLARSEAMIDARGVETKVRAVAEPKDADETLDRDEAAEPAVARLQLLTGQAVRDGAGPGAPVAVEVHAQQAEGAHLLGHLDGERARLEPLGDVRQDAVVHEGPHGVPQEALLVIEQGVDGEEVEGVVAAVDGGGHRTIVAPSRPKGHPRASPACPRPTPCRPPGA